MKAEEKAVPGLRLLNGGLAEGQTRKWGSLGDIKRYEVVPWWILRGGVLHPFMLRVSEGSGTDVL